MYPYYGVECESQCNCSEHQCDATTGCSTSTVGMYSEKELVFFNLDLTLKKANIIVGHNHGAAHIKSRIHNVHYHLHIHCAYSRILNCKNISLYD